MTCFKNFSKTYLYCSFKKVFKENLCGFVTKSKPGVQAEGNTYRLVLSAENISVHVIIK